MWTLVEGSRGLFYIIDAAGEIVDGDCASIPLSKLRNPVLTCRSK